MQKKFHRSYESLEDIFEFSENIFCEQDVQASVRFPVHFVMEELFTNMVKYNPANNNEILLDVSASNGGVTVTMTDYDVEAFDVSKNPGVDVDASLDARTPGGLGLHLIHKMVDSLDYEYQDRQSIITFTKGPV